MCRKQILRGSIRVLRERAQFRLMLATGVAAAAVADGAYGLARRRAGHSHTIPPSLEGHNELAAPNRRLSPDAYTVLHARLRLNINHLQIMVSFYDIAVAPVFHGCPHPLRLP